MNRFYLMDVDARVQLFDLKTKYQFETTPGINQYNMPLYDVQIQPGNQNIASFPVYQGFMSPCFVNGIQVPLNTRNDPYFSLWPTYLQTLQAVAIGDGVTSTFQFNLPFFPAIPGHVDMTGIIATGNNQDPIFSNQLPVFPLSDPNLPGRVRIPTTSFFPGVILTYANANGSNTIITDSGVFLQSGTNQELYGLLMQPGNPPNGNLPLQPTALLPGGTYSVTQNTVNYNTGLVNITFPSIPPAGTQIQAQCYFFQSGIPTSILFYNNILTLAPPPFTQYRVELDAYLTPAAFLNTTNALPFGYMAEYIARGAARKILSDTGDQEQFMFYEPLFREQESLVWKRSQRQFTANRTETIFSSPSGIGSSNNFGQGGL